MVWFQGKDLGEDEDDEDDMDGVYAGSYSTDPCISTNELRWVQRQFFHGVLCV